MSLGLSQKFNILQQSPHDLMPAEPPKVVEEGPIRWVPSRYTVRATTKDGRLILWNTLRGTMSVFKAEQKASIEALLTRKGFPSRSKGIVKYLSDRGFLIKEGTDEYRRLQLGFGNQHYRQDKLELILLSSEDCNFRCQYCYEDFDRGTMKPWVRQGVKNLVEKRLSKLRNLSISWFGGEPLYGFPAIEELAPFFLRVAQENSLGFFSNMTTNGYLLTPEVVDKLLAWEIRKFQVTIDGTPEDHDRNRPARDGQGTFWPIFENLRAMHQRPDDFMMDIRINFDQRNHVHLREFLGMVDEEFGGDRRFRLRFRAVGQWGGPNDQDLEVCGAEDSRRIVAELRQEARKRGLNVTEDIRDVKGLGAQVCYAARPFNFIVGADGKLMKCTIDLAKFDRNIVGQLKEDGEVELDVDKFAMWTEPAFERDTKCQKCVVVPVCQGIFCPQIRFDTGQSPCTPLRMEYKQELRGVVEAAGTDARMVSVGSGT